MAVNIPGIIITPTLNPLQFVPLGTPVTTRYHQSPYLTDWYENNLRKWEQGQPYYQKLQNDAVLWLQFHTNADAILGDDQQLHLYDCHGSIVATWYLTDYTTLPGNLPPAGYGSDPLNTFIFKPDLTGIPAGIYAFVTEFDIDGDPIQQLISEPVSIAAQHPDTCLLQYRNYTNKQGMVFEQLQALYEIRVEGWVHDLDPRSADNLYEDQNNDATLLYSNAFEGWEFNVGGYTGIPLYLLQKINHALSCDVKFIEGRRYEKDTEGSKWETQRVKGWGLVGGSITLREASQSGHTMNIGGQLDQRPDITLGSVPTAYPFAFHSFNLQYLTGAGQQQKQVTRGWIIDDAAGKAAWLQWLNTVALLNAGLFGSFYLDSNVLKYQQAPGENYLNGAAILYVKYFRLKHSTITTSYVLNIGLTMNGGIVIDPDAGQAVAVNQTALGVFPLYTSGAGIVYPKQNIDHNLRIFHDDKVQEMIFSNPRVSTFSGIFPSQLQSFNISSSAVLTSFNFGLLSPAKNVLTSLTIASCTIFTTPLGLATAAWSALNNLDFQNNAFDSVRVDAVFNNYVSGASLPGGNIPNVGTFKTQGQTPPAAPTVGSNNARQQLSVVRNWAITTD